MKEIQKTTGGGSFLTPLRYPGGKGRLGPWIASLLRHNNISGGWYIEPYAGGAGAAFYLLMNGYVDHIVINDSDPVIHAFWQATTSHTDRLIAKIRNTPPNMETWYKQREVVANPESYDVVEVGFAAFFLNRTNRSGILSGGVIGGKEQTGPYKLDARYNIENLISRIAKIGELSKYITVLGMDAGDMLLNASPGFPDKCLVYLDPPYYVKGAQLYRNHYKPDDHAAIADCVVSAKYPVIVTYDDCPEVRNLYKQMESVHFSLHYSTHTARPKTSEVLFFKNLSLPTPPQMTRRRHLDQQARIRQPNSSQNVLSLV
jgi:DNA adenine methylase